MDWRLTEYSVKKKVLDTVKRVILKICYVKGAIRFEFLETGATVNSIFRVKSLGKLIFIHCLFVYLFGFHDISTFVGYLMLNSFDTYKQFDSKQFSLAYNYIVKTFLFLAIQFCQTVLI